MGKANRKENKKMKKDYIKFCLNDNQNIKIVLPNQLSDTYRHDYVKIIFENVGYKYTICEYNYIFTVLESFYYNLKKALSNELELHESIKEDVGYIWNQYLQGNVIVVEEFVDKYSL